eukprot:CAMPEP_0114329206 /NCGR_PEP_ID=MMETSP0101-20121206/925_1 /TAXON_ID=38822 ORGANISM="Pteridomonas danica, Strain PT" /NCGR_SAMPLE_ID=MMETSP0101 /ASSEMBLY_ACC=CAM_ASM_000211 /LENGTH=92 /DNA_ID=CAMNT_0001458797 /DNA_START=1139 /DNA_END=1414 /DNA_ORIENTATION=-
MIWACQTTYASHDLYSNPGVGLVNGSYTIFVMRSTITRLQMIQFFLAAENGQHMDSDGVEIYKATAYRIEPLTERGSFSLDGELIPYGPVQS